MKSGGWLRAGYYVILTFITLRLNFSCFADQSLPEGWWQQSSPESVLTNAQSKTLGLVYFHGSKAHLLTDKSSSIEYFQRKTLNGKIEKKLVSMKFIIASQYYLESGNYFYTHGQVIKEEFELQDEWLQRIASKFDHPYDYLMLKSGASGTNECIIVARIMTTPLVDALVDDEFKELTSEQKQVVSREWLVKNMNSERDFYIRKSDGIIMGYLEKNSIGTVLDDYLYDVVQIDIPIPDEEFNLPKGPIMIARSWNEWSQIDNKLVNEAKAEIRSKVASATQLSRRIILVVLAAPTVLLFWILWVKFRRKATDQASGG